jgi:hypothetical protein
MNSMEYQTGLALRIRIAVGVSGMIFLVFGVMAVERRWIGGRNHPGWWLRRL